MSADGTLVRMPDGDGDIDVRVVGDSVYLRDASDQELVYFPLSRLVSILRAIIKEAGAGAVLEALVERHE